MKHFSSLFLIMIFSVGMTSCSSTKISYDKNVNFSDYHTFAFFKKGIDAFKIPKDKKHFVLKTIDQALQSKGFSKASNPDFIVNIFTDIKNRVDVYQTYYPGWYPSSNVYKSKEATVYIDIVDVKQKKVIWTGETYINFNKNDRTKFKKAVYRLLEKFPPKKEK